VKRKHKQLPRKPRLPLSWRIVSLFSMVPIGLAVFFVVFRKSGGRFPLAAGDSTDPYFFGAIAGGGASGDF
jgi:hypothetical protein